MIDEPLVSICIPTYNRAGMVRTAIESALGQTYKNIEVLVVDNASDDEIESVVASYRDPRVKFFRNARNLGLFGNCNRCVELAQGNYIHILHSDDYIDAEFTRTCMDFFRSHPGVAMTFTSVRAVSGDGEIPVCTRGQDEVFPAPEGFKKLLESRNLVSCPSVMVKKDVYRSIGLYSLEYPYSGDLYQWLKIARRFDIAYVAGATLFYRQGAHSESFQLLFKNPVGYIDTIKILMRVVDELGDESVLYARELNSAFRRHMRDCLFAGIVRSKSMDYPASVFTGLALSSWAMVKPRSLTDAAKKFLEFFQIAVIGCAIALPGGRYCMQKLLRCNPEKY